MKSTDPVQLTLEPMTDGFMLECLERKLRCQRNLALAAETCIARETRTLAAIRSYCVDMESEIARLKARIAASEKEASK